MISILNESDKLLDVLQNYLENSKTLFIHGESFLSVTDQYNEIMKLNIIKTLTIEANPVDIPELNEEFKTVLAVGGGSVIDMAKSLCGEKKLIVVPTLFSTGSMTNSISTIKGINTCKQPDIVVIDPTLQFNLLPNYSTYSIIAIIARMILENINRSKELWTDNIKKVQDLIEIIMRSPYTYEPRKKLIEVCLTIESRETLMEPELIVLKLCRIFKMPYGAGLSMVLPAWLKYNRLFDMDDIRVLENWFHSQGSPIRFSEYNIDEENLPEELWSEYREIFALAL